jgi:hypothetical protein
MEADCVDDWRHRLAVRDVTDLNIFTMSLQNLWSVIVCDESAYSTLGGDFAVRVANSCRQPTSLTEDRTRGNQCLPRPTQYGKQGIVSCDSTEQSILIANI